MAALSPGSSVSNTLCRLGVPAWAAGGLTGLMRADVSLCRQKGSPCMPQNAHTLGGCYQLMGVTASAAEPSWGEQVCAQALASSAPQ